MSKLVWDNTGARLYEAGVEKVVLFVQKKDGTYDKGIAWNGVSAVSETPSGAEVTTIYANNQPYLNLQSAEKFGAKLEAYMYPDEFAACNGEAEFAKGATIGQQTRSQFGLCYRTAIGNDTAGIDFGYKIHIVYNCLAATSEKAYSTINDSLEPITFSYDINTTPVEVAGFKPTAHIVIDSRTTDPAKLTALETILYGDETESSNSRIPLPAEIATTLGTVAP